LREFGRGYFIEGRLCFSHATLSFFVKIFKYICFVKQEMWCKYPVLKQKIVFKAPRGILKKIAICDLSVTLPVLKVIPYKRRFVISARLND
jgi:hypothetical protein